MEGKPNVGSFLVVCCWWILLFPSLSAEPTCRPPHASTHDLVLCVRKGSEYDATQIPRLATNDNESRTVIRIDLNVRSILVDTIEMDYLTQVYIKQSWVDPYLRHKTEPNRNRNYTTFNPQLVDSIWTPDTYIYSVKPLPSVASSLGGGMQTEGLRISPSGLVSYSKRLTLRVACVMAFHDFPMDSQTCYFNLSSYFSTVEDVVYEWAELTVSGMKFGDFHLEKFNRRQVVEQFMSGRFSLLSVSFKMVREANFYILSWYLPAALIVVLSWISFWIDPQATPARVSLTIITILALAGFLVGDKNGFPSVSYIRAIDIYLITCFMFVFGALVEYAMVHYFSHPASAKDENSREKGSHPAENGLSESAYQNPTYCPESHQDGPPPLPASIQDGEQPRNRKFPRRKKCTVTLNKVALPQQVERLDRISRFAFPISFVTFVIFYAIFYTA